MASFALPTPRFRGVGDMDKEHREKFARLLALSKIREAQIRANPVPFLNKLAEENHRLRRAIESALVALSGADDLDFAQDAFPEEPPSIIETALIRNRTATGTLRAALRAPSPTGKEAG